MKFKLPKFLQRSARKSMVSGGSWSTIGSLSDNTFRDWIDPRYTYNGWVAKAISLRANAVASSHFDLFQRKKGGDEVIIKEHPLLTLLDDVNPYFTRNDLFQRLSAHLDLYGNEYWWIVRGSDKKPYEIYPLDPLRVMPIRDPDKYVIGYTYMQINGTPKTIPAKDIIHFKQFNPFDDIFGISSIEIAAGLILTDRYRNAWSKNYFKNSAMPDVIIEVPAELGPDQVAAIRQDWINEFSGTDRVGKPAVLHSGTKVNALQKSIADMQIVAQQNSSRDDILAMFGVPKVMLGLLENVNLANATTAEGIFRNWTIYPINMNIASTINEFLLPQFEGEQDYTTKSAVVYYMVPSKVVLSDKDTTERNKILFEDGIITKNEWRASEGLATVDEGDMYYEQPKDPVPQNQDTQPADNGDLSKTNDDLATFIRKRIKQSVRKDLTSLPKQQRMSPEKFEQTGSSLKAKQDAIENKYIDAMKDAVKGLLEQQVTRALHNVESPSKAFKALLNKKRELKATIDLMTPLIEAVLAERGEATMQEVNSPTAWDDNTEAVNAYIKNNTNKLASSMTDTTMEAIRSAVAEGFAAGEGIAGIKKRIQESKDLGDYRAETIALSETHRASAFAELEALKQSKLVISKIWFTAQDERVCPQCNAMNGVEVGIDEPFIAEADLDAMNIKNYEGDIQIAMLHPRCRCTIIPVLIQ